MQTILLTFLALGFLAIPITSSELKGHVKTSSGKPLSEVIIIYGRSLIELVRTDSDGSFSLPSYDKVIFFRHPGYTPVTKIIETPIQKLEVVMVEDKNDTIALATCPSEKEKKQRLGDKIKLRPPAGTKSQNGFDTDYGYFSIGKKVERRLVWISGFYGPMASLGVPHYDWILNAAEFTERSFNGRFSDMRGRAKDGTYWRFIGAYGEQIEYSGLTAKESEFFDTIIAQACK